jgi:hypothetical protein
MASKKMPPELLAHFKKKQGEGEDKKASPEEKKEGDKKKRSEAVKKARIRMEAKNDRRKATKDTPADK